MPESLAGLLPPDFVADPSAIAAPVLVPLAPAASASVVTGPFEVPGETWLVEVDAAEGVDSWAGAFATPATPIAIIEVDDNREYLYNVAPGHYYWDVTASDCDWSVDLAPIEIGPDPNATPVPRVPAPALFGQQRVPGEMNEKFLTAPAARQAILDAGLVVGECVEQINELVTIDRVWGQDPQPGTLLELGSPVTVYIGTNCDVVLGDRILQ